MTNGKAPTYYLFISKKYSWHIFNEFSFFIRSTFSKYAPKVIPSAYFHRNYNKYWCYSAFVAVVVSVKINNFWNVPRKIFLLICWYLVAHFHFKVRIISVSPFCSFLPDQRILIQVIPVRHKTTVLETLLSISLRNTQDQYFLIHYSRQAWKCIYSKKMTLK